MTPSLRVGLRVVRLPVSLRAAPQRAAGWRAGTGWEGGLMLALQGGLALAVCRGAGCGARLVARVPGLGKGGGLRAAGIGRTSE